MFFIYFLTVPAGEPMPLVSSQAQTSHRGFPLQETRPLKVLLRPKHLVRQPPELLPGSQRRSPQESLPGSSRHRPSRFLHHQTKRIQQQSGDEISDGIWERWRMAAFSRSATARGSAVQRRLLHDKRGQRAATATSASRDFKRLAFGRI